MASKRRVIIMGAAGRDFHNFNVFFRDNEEFEVVAFTATQIPDIEGRKYPPELSGKLYPDGIPIYPEEKITELIDKNNVDMVVFAYSDLPYSYVMTRSAIVNAAGADFVLMGPNNTMLKSTKPVIAVCAVRTGCGKSQISRNIFQILRNKNLKVASIRHPMPYDQNITMQTVQKFASYEDLDRYNCTIEEREEYEPYIDMNGTIYAGVDYEKILREAEKDADVIIWDGGNNDFSFIKPDLLITIADPHRAGHEVAYYPGEVNARAADVIIINKIDTADPLDTLEVRENIRKYNSGATVIDAASPITVENPELIKGKKVLVVEDGPTLTHGEMTYGAGTVASEKFGAKEILDPRPWLVGEIKETFKKYPDIGNLLPAMGYSSQQIKDLEETINKVPADTIVVGTPIDLTRIIKVNKPAVRVKYELQEIGKPTLEDIIGKMKL